MSQFPKGGYNPFSAGMRANYNPNSVQGLYNPVNRYVRGQRDPGTINQLFRGTSYHNPVLDRFTQQNQSLASQLQNNHNYANERGYDPLSFIFGSAYQDFAAIGEIAERGINFFGKLFNLPLNYGNSTFTQSHFDRHANNGGYNGNSMANTNWFQTNRGQVRYPQNPYEASYPSIQQSNTILRKPIPVDVSSLDSETWNKIDQLATKNRSMAQVMGNRLYIRDLKFWDKLKEIDPDLKEQLTRGSTSGDSSVDRSDSSDSDRDIDLSNTSFKGITSDIKSLKGTLESMQKYSKKTDKLDAKLIELHGEDGEGGIKDKQEKAITKLFGGTTDERLKASKLNLKTVSAGGDDTKLSEKTMHALKWYGIKLQGVLKDPAKGDDQVFEGGDSSKEYEAVNSQTMQAIRDQIIDRLYSGKGLPDDATQRQEMINALADLGFNTAAPVGAGGTTIAEHLKEHGKINDSIKNALTKTMEGQVKLSDADIESFEELGIETVPGTSDKLKEGLVIDVDTALELKELAKKKLEKTDKNIESLKKDIEKSSSQKSLVKKREQLHTKLIKIDKKLATKLAKLEEAKEKLQEKIDDEEDAVKAKKLEVKQTQIQEDIDKLEELKSEFDDIRDPIKETISKDIYKALSATKAEDIKEVLGKYNITKLSGIGKVEDLEDGDINLELKTKIAEEMIGKGGNSTTKKLIKYLDKIAEGKADKVPEEFSKKEAKGMGLKLEGKDINANSILEALYNYSTNNLVGDIAPESSIDVESILDDLDDIE